MFFIKKKSGCPLPGSLLLDKRGEKLYEKYIILS